MKARIFLVVAWAAAISLAPAGMVRAEESRAQISVAGQGQVAAVPDMATINLGVTNQASEASAAMAATSTATALILKQLRALGIEARDMQTSNLSLAPLWSNNQSSGSPNAKITGYVASNQVLVRVRNLDDLGTVLEAVVGQGANNFNGLQFSLQDPDPLLDQARELAVADAIARAKLLALAAGIELGGVLSMTEQGTAAPVMMQAQRGAVPIAAGEVSLSASVGMVFAIRTRP